MDNEKQTTTLETTLVQEIVNYLVKRPYQDVAPMLGKLASTMQSQEEAPKGSNNRLAEVPA